MCWGVGESVWGERGEVCWGVGSGVARIFKGGGA